MNYMQALCKQDSNIKVSKQDHDQWINSQWLFDKLSDLTLGQSFCKKFHVQDYYLLNSASSNLFAAEWIRNNYLQ